MSRDDDGDDVDEQLSQRLRSEDARVTAMVRDELEETLRAVRESLSDAQPTLQHDIEQLTLRAQRYYEGVEAWQQKAQTAVRAMQEQQRALNAMVHDATLRATAQQERLLREQHERTATARETCARLLREVDTAV